MFDSSILTPFGIGKRSRRPVCDYIFCANIVRCVASLGNHLLTRLRQKYSTPSFLGHCCQNLLALLDLGFVSLSLPPHCGIKSYTYSKRRIPGCSGRQGWVGGCNRILGRW